MVETDPSLPTGFRIYQELDYGIYECDPIGVRHSEHNYPYWIIASLNLKTKLEDSDLVNVSDFKPINGKDGQYTAMANGKPIISIPQIVFKKYYGDEDGDFGVDDPRIIPTSEKDRKDVARSVNIDHLITPEVKRGRKIELIPISNIHRTQRDSSPDSSPGRHSINLFSSSYKDLSIRKKLKEIIDTIPPTIPLFKKKKNSLRKSKKNSVKKSKTSIKCKKTPYAWKSSSIKKSPFRKLERAKDAERQYKAGKSIGFTVISSLKSLGRIPRSDGCYVLGAKYSVLKGH